MNITPGDIVSSKQGWSISKRNVTLSALGKPMGNNLLVVATNEVDDTFCVLTREFGLVWVHYDSRNISVVR